MNNQYSRIINHKALRRNTGLIAIFLAFVVQGLSGYGLGLSSISLSYWTASGDIFVGSLAAIAFFLAAYNGTDQCQKDAEYWISKFAGFFAIIVALVPTKNTIDKTPAPYWVDLITFNNTPLVHNVAAILLFVCLFFLITFFARRAKYKGKHGRSTFYTLISLGMLIGMPLVYFILRETKYAEIYWVEVVGLVLFGIGWLVAGTYKSEPAQKIPKSFKKIEALHVDAKAKRFPTGIKVIPGEKYIFIAKGCWQDWFLSCGPTGWGPSWGILANRNQLKGEPIFMLCGSIGKETSDFAFAIGHRKNWTVPNEIGSIAPENHELFLFANDWPNKYHNNSGTMEVTIYKQTI